MTVHADTSPGRVQEKGRGTAQVSLPRLYILRVGYLLFGVGLAVTKWPSFIQHIQDEQPWPLMEGVVQCMLIAMSVLALVGIRYPVRMLPLLLFESAWKLLWLAVVALPLWTTGGMDATTWEVAFACLFVVIVLAAIPWRYVLANYVTSPGDRWRSAPSH